MNFINRKIFLAVVLLSGCGAIPTTENYNTRVQSWVGSHVSVLEGSWGYPTRKIEAYNRNVVYVFDRSSAITMPTTANTTYSPAVTAGGVTYVPASSQTQISGGQSYVLSCSTFFTINKDSGVIENVRFQGNNCKS